MTPEEIAARQVADAPYVRWSAPARLFSERALRLRQLAAGHAMRDYLIFIADLADAQQQALNVPRTLDLPSQDHLGQAARAGVAPLAPGQVLRQAAWAQDLAHLLSSLSQRLTPGPARAVVQELQALPAQELERQADRLLHGVMLDLNLGFAPLIAAGLQVYWARWVAQTQAQYPELAFGRVDNASLCPCCASKPVASVVGLGSGEAAARYVHCSLCQSQWHAVRISCVQCGSNKKIFYQELEQAQDQAPSPTAAPKGAVRAECCDDCGHYLKIMAMDKDAYVDPVADDLATLALDLLLAETGRQRHGHNLMLLLGAPPEESDDGPGQVAEPPDSPVARSG